MDFGLLENNFFILTIRFTSSKISSVYLEILLLFIQNYIYVLWFVRFRIKVFQFQYVKLHNSFTD